MLPEAVASLPGPASYGEIGREQPVVSETSHLHTTRGNVDPADFLNRGETMPDDKPSAELLELTTKIVAAHVSHNAVPTTDLPGLIATVHQALATVGTQEAAGKPKPAVSIKQSVKPEYIVCLEDGTEHKMLKRHLKTAHDMTPDDYRKRWGLPRDYPLVSPNYAAVRGKIAKKLGLGRKTGTKMKARRKA